MRSSLLTLIVVTAFASAVSCDHAEQTVRTKYVQPYPDSEVMTSSNRDGAEGLTYEVNAPYPAEPVLKFIESQVPPAFKPRKESFLNPGIPTSQVRGWTSYGDHTTKPHTWVHHWSGEWEDPAGNILSYDLMYRSESEDGLQRPTSPRLLVSGGYLPRHLVDAMKASTPAAAMAEPLPAAEVNRVVRPGYIIVRAKNDPNILMDLRDFQLDRVDIHRMEPTGIHALSLATNAPGDRKLESWTSANVGRQLEIYLDNELISSNIVETPISGIIWLNGDFSKSQAEEIAARVRRGGA